jgi:hypothetical protein
MSLASSNQRVATTKKYELDKSMFRATRGWDWTIANISLGTIVLSGLPVFTFLRGGGIRRRRLEGRKEAGGGDLRGEEGRREETGGGDRREGGRKPAEET